MLSEADLFIVGRAALAAALGFVIGWERQAAGGAIRARTIALAALTAATLTALGHELFATGADRIVQGIVTGIGFLGGGVIMRGASGELRGLTTAASLWAMTGIGVAVGSGHELLGVLLAALVYLIAAWGDWPVLAQLRWRGPGRTASDASGHRDSDIPSDGIRSPAAAGRESDRSPRTGPTIHSKGGVR
jgi:putative Mg2+ transporter-C (MgtC) family protein